MSNRLTFKSFKKKWASGPCLKELADVKEVALDQESLQEKPIRSQLADLLLRLTE
jgi:hypothetical protein